jgi:protoheme IX farnesyltransferase
MQRTAHRPLANDAISVRGAVVFGFTLLALAVALMLAWVNPLAAMLTLAANVFYVGVYTALLKRRTPQNIVWGGVAGCMPTLIGWAAVTGQLAWPPVVLFLVVFFWTPPHYWPLAMRFRDDYARAGVPMLPVVAGQVRVAREILAYSVAMVVTSLILVPVAGMGRLYTTTAVVVGLWFLAECVRLLRRAARAQPVRPMRLFHGSITYLTVLFLAVAVDAVLA